MIFIVCRRDNPIHEVAFNELMSTRQGFCLAMLMEEK